MLEEAAPAGLTPYGVALRTGGHPPRGPVPLGEVRAALAVLRDLIAAGQVRRDGQACYLAGDG